MGWVPCFLADSADGCLEPEEFVMLVIVGSFEDSEPALPPLHPYQMPPELWIDLEEVTALASPRRGLQPSSSPPHLSPLNCPPPATPASSPAPF